MDYQLIHGGCIEEMKNIPENSVDMILCDLPYGTTACAWDVIIPFDLLWQQYKRIIKNNRAIVLTASQPFTSALVLSNIEMFKYCWVWHKSRAVGFVNAKLKPMNQHEDIIVFSFGKTSNYNKNNMIYNPQGLLKKGTVVKGRKGKASDSDGNGYGRPSMKDRYTQEWTNYPTTYLNIKSESKPIHPTQKPVELMEYLIKTYTNQGESVLDNCMGSGTTGVAALNTERKFIGIEKDLKYFEIAKERIKNTYNSKQGELF